MATIAESKTRTFGGKLSGFESRHEANFETAHLKNYLKGNKTSNFGFHINPLTGMRRPITRVVKEVWI